MILIPGHLTKRSILTSDSSRSQRYDLSFQLAVHEEPFKMIRQRGRFTERGDVAVLRSVLSVAEFYPNVLRDLRYVVSMTLTLLFFLNVISHHIFQTPENILFRSKVCSSDDFCMWVPPLVETALTCIIRCQISGEQFTSLFGTFCRQSCPKLRNDVRQLSGMAVRSINALSLSRLLDPK